MITKRGISASPGVAIGSALVLDTEVYRIPRPAIAATQVEAEIDKLDAALEASRQEVSELCAAATRKLGEKTSAIFAYHEQFIADPKLREVVIARIRKNRSTAAQAFSQEMAHQVRLFRSIPNQYLKERVRDLADIEQRVLRHILGRAREDIARLTESVIVVAEELTPSQAVSLDRRHILGFGINVGGQTSHTSIIARMLGIPAVVALKDITNDVSGGDTLIIDGTHGIVIVNPDDDTIEHYRAQQQLYRETEIELRELRDVPATTLDDVKINLRANIEMPTESEHARNGGAEGVGLYRTEFLFLAHERLPSEEQQYEAFREAVQLAEGKPVVLRTMDLGADKIAHSMGPQHDHNPVLGLRSLRYCLLHLDMFKTHLRAILRASVEGDTRIMFPMIATLMELRQAKATLADVMEDLDEEGIPYRRDIPIGIMVETPAAALMASAFVKEVAFLSIGTNDLTQYTLAVDRGNERVAHLYCPHNPAVLKLIHQVAQIGRQAGVGVSVCGEMAGDTTYTQLLLGMGIRELSMAPKDIPETKRVIRATSIQRCEEVTQRVLQFDSDRQVLNFLRDSLREIRPDAD